MTISAVKLQAEVSMFRRQHEIGLKGLRFFCTFPGHLGSEDVLNDGMPDLLALELAYGGGGKAKKARAHLKRMR